ncbi:virulence RhuM family protein [Aquimarina litoralis]|uniref:Virulence RhuM family protein n=1 Tax=Aquimarina litoralis TaxID=584605 RepID=A0ABP3UJZ0_9FLAO
MGNLEEQKNFLFYSTDDGNVNIQVILDDDTVWVTQNSMADIFDTTKQNISQHLNNIYNEGELNKFATVKDILTVRKEGSRNVQRSIEFYNLDAIISVGYRVNSPKATTFRIWATSILKEYLIKGFALDDDRLKQGKTLFDKDYFDELLERIREIRASERRFYQKITDLYATAVDYDPNSQVTKDFYATVQNKLHWAIHNHTAAELISKRADSSKPNMGLTTWKNSKTQGKILKSDVSVAKNYLSQKEVGELNRVVGMYLDFAENMAERNKTMKMVDWVKRLDAFLDFNEYGVLKDSGKISAKIAKRKAEKEYDRFRIVQDKEFISDFDKVVNKIKTTGELPNKEDIKKENELSKFNQNLKKGLNWNPKDHK